MFEHILGLILVSLSAVAFAAPSVATAGAIDCFVQCSSGNCVVTTPASKDGRRLAPNGASLHIEQCGEAKLEAAAELQGQFMSARGMERFKVATENTPFAKLVPSIKNGICVASPKCMESRDRSRVPLVAGKGVDKVTSRRVGQPCELGLPCGPILRPAGALTFEVAGGPTSGRLRLTGVRGNKSEQSIPLRGGRIEMPAGSLQPSGVYAYSLFDAAGTEVAAGEFSVLSGKIQADVEADMNALPGRGRGPATLDLIELLLDNELNWDAMRQAR
jgi:hypothetical protein